MKLWFLGHACFFLETKKAKLVLDPYDPTVGLGTLNLSADVLVTSHNHRDHNYKAGVRGAALVDRPGHYEFNGILLDTLETDHDDQHGSLRGRVLMTRILADGITLAHLGDVGAPLTAREAEWIGHPDVLMLPVGGIYTQDAAQAAATVRTVAPHVVIPMHYALEHLTFKLGKVADFLAQMGLENAPSRAFWEIGMDVPGGVLILKPEVGFTGKARERTNLE